MARTFYDVHMHAMDLSHPNLLAFMKRIHGLGPMMVVGGMLEPLLGEKKSEILNLLTVMENSIDDYFCLMEYFLRTKNPVLDNQGVFQVSGEPFDRIVLTPLIMDFGLKHIETDTFYDIAVGKPVAEQSADVLKAIAKYVNCEVVSADGNRKHIKVAKRSSRQLFEIYPFLGINTQNYPLEELQDLLLRCFGGYTGNRDQLNRNMGIFRVQKSDSDDFRDALRGVGSNVFAGIKLYPPLGFDPWPRGSEKEFEKVRWLYQFCQDKQIPITAHCNDGGFQTVDNAAELTNPEKWEKVLEQFEDLKLNLAHFGRQEKFLGLIHPHEWRETITRLILMYPNVYTDISCLAFADEFYGDLAEVVRNVPEQGPDRGRDKLAKRLLFGSDYMINLQWIASYNDYLDLFLTTRQLERMGIAFDLKLAMCNTNAERFLFK
ncbi:amidohydrolase family protein [Geomesophilobacter sediminis]|uniref:Amidohydrolase n=1 Tax=Geomesophilobacter sediminis TaxID=2798584 RepID=A0A8J7LV70_9BACT|nr:amidohydrolase family protein [Geomesophilobacter sediminis]MBJ6724615.1 amidohydrolase [Geomesophilobacter sediminis]